MVLATATFQLREQHPRVIRRYLILDGDMRPPRGLILRNQPPAQGVGKALAQILQPLARHTQRGSGTQRDRTGDMRYRRRHIARLAPEQPQQFVQHRRRQMMEQGQMRGQQVALNRKMGAAKGIEPLKVRRTEQRGDDDRRRQIST